LSTGQTGKSSPVQLLVIDYDQRGHLQHHSSPLGPQRLSSQFDLESELWRGPWNHHRLGLRGLIEAVVLPLVLLVLFVFPLVNAVQARAAFSCRRPEGTWVLEAC